MITAIALLFNVVHVSIGHQLLSFGTMLAWSFVMFSFMHDAMHVEGFWMEKNRWLRHWFLAARRFHDIHHRELNDSGLMNKNFGIGFYFFDRLFGTFSAKPKPFNHHGYAVASEKFKNLCRLSTARPTDGFYKS
jgi:sterol desaturase/sphingolipid hydroxylase (fatty acid hydroxylase superfamily)